jgi:hypothetical protein
MPVTDAHREQGDREWRWRNFGIMERSRRANCHSMALANEAATGQAAGDVP